MRVGFGALTNEAKRLVADEFGASDGILIEMDLVRSVDLVIRENAVLQHKPARSPAFTVIDPFVENPRDSIADDFVDLWWLL